MTGRLVPWPPSDPPYSRQVSPHASSANIAKQLKKQPEFRHWTAASYSDRASPLHRISELFNCNHFLISQARPFLLPFVQADMHGPAGAYSPRGEKSLSSSALRLVALELNHRLNQLDTMGLLPRTIRRFVLSEDVPGSSVTIVPEMKASDFLSVLDRPSKSTLGYWVKKGERSVWPAVGAIKVRYAVESELDRGYQYVRRRKAGHLRRRGSTISVRKEKE
jgi:TAG lipase/lysophosphatidylethanolamine acyltransferase